MPNKTDTTIVLQGYPSIGVTEHLISGYCRKFDNVIYSTWHDFVRQDAHTSQAQARGIIRFCSQFPNIKVVLASLPSTTTIWNDRNVYYQCLSTLNGLRLVDTPFTIKVRADYPYDIAESTLDILEKTPDKIIANNVFFLKDWKTKYHPGDHVIAGRTQYLKQGFEIATSRCRINQVARYYLPDLSAETHICASLLEAKGVTPTLNESIQIMVDNYDVVPGYRLQSGAIPGSDQSSDVYNHAKLEGPIPGRLIESMKEFEENARPLQ